MADAAISCPSRQVLSAFSLGKLSNADMALVAGHLETCAECSRLLEQLPPDSFVGKVRGAKPTSGTQLPIASRLDGLALKSDGPPPADLPPELAKHPKYRIVRELGRGGMGVVYEAIHTGMDRRIAIKVINPSLLEHPDALPRFQSEVKAAGRLEHENIVRAYDTDTAGNLHLLVMEFVQGKNLADWVRQQGPLTTVSACLCIRQAALGLQYAYEQGMVHRDIKPHNLMATAQGKLKILDFGLARVRGKSTKGRLTQVDAFMGTAEYVSPEQATDARNADIRSDIYSLGCTLYFLLTGRPFQAETLVKLVLAQIEQEPKPVHEVRAEVPEALSAVVARMLAKDPAQRYQTPVEVAQAMVPFLKAGVKSNPAAVPLPPEVSSPGKATVIGADTSQMPKVGRFSTPPPVRRVETEAKPFNGSDSVKAPKAPKRKRRKPKNAPAWQRPATIAGSLMGLLALILIGLWAGGVIWVKTAYGTIVLKHLPPEAEVTVDGKKVTVKHGNGNAYEISVSAAQKHQLQVKMGGVTLVGEEVRIDAGERWEIEVTLQPRLVKGETLEPQSNKAKTPRSELDQATKSSVSPPSMGKEPQRVEPTSPIDPKLRRAYKNLNGDWTIDGTDLVQNSLHDVCDLVFGDFSWKDYNFTCDVMMTTGGTRNKQVELVYRVTGSGKSHFVLGGTDNTRDSVCGVEHGALVEFKARRNTWDADRWHRVTVRLRGAHCECCVGDQLIFEYEDSRNPHGAVGLRTHRAAARFRNIRVTDPIGKVLFDGLPDLPAATDQWPPTTAPTEPHELQCLKGHGAPVFNASFSPDGRQIVSVSDGRVWGDTIGPNGSNVIEVPAASTVRLWEAETGNELDRTAIRPSYALRRHQFAWIRGSPHFFTAFYETSPPNELMQVRSWSIDGNRLKSELLFTDLFGGSLELSLTPSGRKVRALWESGQLFEWDINTRTLSRRLPAFLKSFEATCEGVSPDGRLALFTRDGHPFSELDLSSGKETSRWKQPLGVIRCLVFSPDSNRVLTGGQDGSLRLWDTAKAEQLHLVGTQQLPVTAVAFSPDGKRALSGGADHTVRLWDLEGVAKESVCFVGHTLAVRAVAFSPDGLRAISGSADHTVRIWRLPAPASAPLQSPSYKKKPYIELEEIPRKPVKPLRVEDDEVEGKRNKQAVPRPTGEEGFLPLFNGKDLKGWKTLPEWKEDWRVNDGILVCTRDKAAYLWTERDDYKDFRLKVEARTIDTGLAQLCMRFPADDKDPGQGYRAAINGGKNYFNQVRTGALSRFGQVMFHVEKSPVRPNQWFTLEVTVQGYHFEVKVNDQTTAACDDPKRLFSEGCIAVASAVPGVEFRKIEIKELPSMGDMQAQEEMINKTSAATQKAKTAPRAGSQDEQRERRQKRWTIRFAVKDSGDYLRQLAGLGAILAIPQSDGTSAVIRDLKRVPRTAKVEDISAIKNYCFTDDRAESVRGLVAALGREEVPPYVIAFFPKALEDQLFQRELAYQNKPERAIKMTYFVIKKDVRGMYFPDVVKQE